ncbi:MAG: cysteine peptidase family C39 domain-containing protein [Chlorobi bacterium]|nr:cysteine peptidase family C39 domain-containing protein [Chlorobiota bacterium]MCI0715491.1 cysteine peptidase family C39 domain-containing protein [Chlorobiota bacterium]
MTYHRQETKFTCGPASVRNSLLAMGYAFSERRIRELAGSDREKGTSEKKIKKALKHLGFRYKEFYNKTESAFKQRVKYNLKKGNKLVILTDHEDHWVSAIDYENKYVTVIDPEQKRVKIHLTPKALSKWCLNFNKRTKNTYYYGIIIIKQEE